MINLSELPELGEDAFKLVQLVSQHCYLPHPETVAEIEGAIFPSIRDQKNRISVSNVDGQEIFLDDNTTPRWSLLWSHGYSTTAHPRGWTFAHIWASVKDPSSYTHLANLAMLPEYFGSLSDKDGPLTHYLKYHAYSIYDWKPDGERTPEKPASFDEIEWNYLEKVSDPMDFIVSRMKQLNNERVRLLRPLMGIEVA